MSVSKCSTTEICGFYVRSGSIVALMAISLLTGCSESKFEYAPVSGQVTLDGHPVARARVVFMPKSSREDGEAGPFSNGETDAEGRYQLKTVSQNSANGAVVGRHRIIISTRRMHMDPDNPDREILDSKETIPRVYNDYTKSKLEFVVSPDGTDAADFVLVSDGGQ